MNSLNDVTRFSDCCRSKRGARHLVGGEFVDDDVGLLLDELDEVAQLGGVQRLAGLVLQVGLHGLDLRWGGGFGGAVALDEFGFDDVGADGVEQARRPGPSG